MSSNLRVNNILPSVGTNVSIGTAGGSITYNASVSGVSTFSNGITVGTGASISSPATNVLTLGTSNVESVRVDSSSNVGINTANPTDKLTVLGAIQVQQNSSSSNRLILRGQPSSSYRWNIDNNGSNNSLRIFREDDATAANGVVYAGITSTGNFQFNSGYGSAGTVYGCRAWVNFDGTKDTTGATSTANTNRLIRASGNVTSVLRNGAGDYTVNFTTAMPDANYCVNVSAESASVSLKTRVSSGYSTTSCSVRMSSGDTSAYTDQPSVFVAIFR